MIESNRTSRSIINLHQIQTVDNLLSSFTEHLLLMFLNEILDLLNFSIKKIFTQKIVTVSHYKQT